MGFTATHTIRPIFPTIIFLLAPWAQAKDFSTPRPTMAPVAATNGQDLRNVDAVIAAKLATDAAEPKSDEPDPSLMPSAQRLLLRFRPGVASAARDASHGRAFAGKIVTSYRRLPGMYLVEAPVGELDAALAAYRSDPNVLYAEPDSSVSIHATPDDPFFDQQWGLRNNGEDNDPSSGVDLGTPGADIRATDAWEIWTGDPAFRIAVIDTGLNYLHPDLAANTWTNPREIPGNGLDDDGNGWIDDVHGYDFVNDDGDPFDDNGHGSHVSGILGAVGNNGIGIAGVNWRCQIVALKALGSNGQGLISDVIEAIDYALANDIIISNNSWGTIGPFSQALYDAIAEAQAQGHLFVASAGNFFGRDIDDFPVYPASFDLPNILVVATSDNDDRLGFFSNIGPRSVDLSAPGVSILSTVFGEDYFYLSGTSMAVPHVTGTAALLWSRRPELSWDQVKERLLATVRPSDALADLTLSGGVVDAAAAVGDCNTNGTPDELEIAAGDASDCNLDGIPDECQKDCNANGVHDDCELTSGAALDCNANGVPDECDLAAGTSADCNTNGIPDECDLASGLSTDENDSGSPDECERCTTDEDCDDGVACTANECTLGLCFATFPDQACDDGDACTENDQCAAGACVGSLIPTLECAPTISLKVAQLNGQVVTGDRTSEITAARGDRLTLELTLEDWSPETIQAYNAVVEEASFRSGDTGSISPLRTPDPGAGMFVNEDRPDFLFFAVPAFTFVLNDTLSFYQYGSVVLLESKCARDEGGVAYLGSLIVDVSATASGTFSLCLKNDNRQSTFLLDCPNPVHLPPNNIVCATIHIPLEDDDCIPTSDAAKPDCNGNQRWDICDLADGISQDCNENDVPDSCDIEAGVSQDCNGNGLPDECDISAIRSKDCDRNGVPDECQPDCNANGIADPCDLSSRRSVDCNGNAVPDECDLADGTSNDCDGQGNGIPDECEPDCNGNLMADTCDLNTGTSVDEDDNTVPDDCQQTHRVPDDYETIQEAIIQAEDGDTILLADGVYAGADNVRLDFLGKILLLRSENGPAKTIIDLQEDEFAIHIQRGESSTTRIEGLTIRNGVYAIVVTGDSSPEIRNCVFENCRNAGIIMSPGSPLIEDCVIKGTWPGRGITCLRGSDATIRNCVVTGEGIGGVFSRQSNPTFTGCLIADHTNGGIGVGLRLLESTVSLDNCTITNNAGTFGPVLHMADSTAFIENSIIWDNGFTIGRVDECLPPDCYLPLLVLSQSSRLRVASSDVENGINAVRLEDDSVLKWSPSNISVDPSFDVECERILGAKDGRCRQRLSAASPCIDYGPPADDTAAYERDLDGHRRVLCGSLDLGAFEFGIGDATCNRSISWDDAVFWPACLNGPGSAAEPTTCQSLDFEFDRDVDLKDFAQWQVRFQGLP